MDIIWHLGFQKTGTTTIQRMIDINHDRLSEKAFIANKGKTTDMVRRRGVRYCEMRDPNAHLQLAHRLNELRGVMEGSGQNTALFSDEVVMGHHVIRPDSSFLDSAERLIPMIEKAFDGHTNHFVFYTRAFPAWLRSAYNQGVKVLRYAMTYDDWIKDYPHPTNWEAIETRLRGQVRQGHLSFVSMEDDAPCLGATLFRLIGCSDADLAALTRPADANVSLPEGALTFLRILNGSEIPEEQLRVVRRKIRTNPQLFAKTPKT